ncbi:MAG: 3-phosphoshikimate 1-carboxyvinyltransferase [Methanosarcinales archaeon]|nr:MAG: 3-phosphoshikimate 1-carboxyvinyltransferase [Methanosarcinales archaeon]
MNVKVRPSVVHGDVYAPPSKSYTHRAMTIAALGKKAEISYPLLSKDTMATVRACEAFGATIHTPEEKEDILRIIGVDGHPKVPEDVINAANSGTTLRFMAAVGSLVDGAVVLTSDDSLRKRPNGPLLKALNDLGANAFSAKDDGAAPIVVKGKLKGGEATISGEISSQFISALLLACPFACEDTVITVKGKLKSKPYVEMTLDMLESAGAKIVTDFTKFEIPHNQKFDLGSYVIPGDFSSASYLLAAGAITNSKVVVRNLIPSKQGDVAIVSILQQMGADVVWDQDVGVVTVDGADLKGIRIDVGAHPDLVPTLAVLGTCAEGVTEITNAAHLRYKETDRLRAMSTELRKMGAKVKELPDGLVIEKSRLHGARLHGYNDHRIVMALTVAGLVAEGETVIDDAESVEVSYPDFFDDLFSMGANIGVE